ncbi:hypothetical protein LTR42_001062 [Elasticomyces elasticus]|nr:hypothetical protein LTR42_001062 [Elasticomyces elasticus]
MDVTPAQELQYINQAFLLAEHTCTAPWVLSYSQRLPGVPIKFHELLIILGAIGLILNFLLSLYLVWGHCFNWTKPMEQKQ